MEATEPLSLVRSPSGRLEVDVGTDDMGAIFCGLWLIMAGMPPTWAPVLRFLNGRLRWLAFPAVETVTVAEWGRFSTEETEAPLVPMVEALETLIRSSGRPFAFLDLLRRPFAQTIPRHSWGWSLWKSSWVKAPASGPLETCRKPHRLSLRVKLGYLCTPRLACLVWAALELRLLDPSGAK